MNKIIAIIFCLGFTFAAYADDGSTRVNVTAGATAQAVAQGGSINTSSGNAPVFMPNANPAVTPNPTNFTKSPTLAENNNELSRVLAELSNANIPDADVLDTERAQPEFAKTDFALMVWNPNKDFFVNDPASRNAKVTFGPSLTSYRVISDYFARIDSKKTYFVLGHVAARTVFDEEKQDITLADTLVMQALRFAKNANGTWLNQNGEPRFVGYSKPIIPVVVYENNTYFHGTAVSGSGIQVTPQVSGLPAAGVGVGSIFSWGKNHGLAVESNGTGVVVYFITEAPNATLGHPIPAMIQKISAAQPRQ